MNTTKTPTQSESSIPSNQANPQPSVKPNWFAQHWIISLLALLIGSCSFFTRDRTVSWEEEVPLNTGETIWVKRYVTYKFEITQDNPFVPEYVRLGDEGLEFEYQGRKYSYVGQATIMVLAINPTTHLPIIIGPKSTQNWVRSRDYPCSKPYYEQLIVDEKKWEWKVLPAVEPWMFKLQRNLMNFRGQKMGDMRAQYSSNERKIMDADMTRRSPSFAEIDPNYQPESCLG